jgi:TonB-linked SusC/RagA family outer membrane protein
MQKKQCLINHEWLKKRLFVMQLIFSLLLIGCIQASASAFAQTTVSLNLRNVTLHQVIWEIEKQTDFDFIYNTEDVDAVKIEKLVLKDQPVEKVLNEAIGKSGLGYTYHDGVVVIKPESKATAVSNQNPDIVLKGTVMDNSGATLLGVSVLLKGATDVWSITDIDGNFEIKLPAGSSNILIFSYIGMKKQEVKVAANSSPLHIVLQEDESMLNEVVVTGYGNLKKGVYAGSASVIKTEKLKDVPVVSVNNLLQGNAPGVFVSSGTNQPGSLTTVRIRGVGSFNAGTNPLYVIDGVAVISGDISSVSSITSNAPGTDALSTLDVSDIENIAVIKDAAAASLYGSRAANGVIIITTKSGKKGKPVFNLKANTGFSDFATKYRTVMGGQQRRDLMIEGLRNEYTIKGGIANYTDADDYVNKNIDKYAPIPWCGFIDWDDILFRRGHYQNYEASASGGTDMVKVYSSLSYTDQEGNTMNSGLKRINGRVNLDWNATNKLTIGIKSQFSDVKQDVFSEGTVYTSPYYSSRNAVVPSDPVYLEDGSYNRSFIRNSDRNPKLAQDYNFKNESLTRVFNIIYGQYAFLPELKFKTTYSYDYTVSIGDTWDDPRTSDGRSSNGSRSKSIFNYKKWVWSNSLGYNKQIAENHFLDAIAAFDMEEYSRDYLYGNTKSFVDPNMDAISNGAEPTSVSGSPTGWRMASIISRLDYNYMGKYYLGASYRYDGSSRLSPKDNNRWGSFWSASGSWRITEEAFMENTRDILSDLRLRFSYGTNGTLPSDSYGYLALSSLNSSYMGVPGIITNRLENPTLKWEQNYNTNLGLDIGLFNRINIALELYNRTTKDLLNDLPISMSTGLSTYLKNIGSVKNRGFELEITSSNIETKDFRWTTGLNLGQNKNKILNWDGIMTEYVSGNFNRSIGMPYYTYYMIEFAGIDPEDGEAQFYLNKKNSDGSIDRGITKDYREAEKVTFKGIEPTLSGGLTNTFSYKFVDLSFTFNFAYGGNTYDNGAQKAEHGGSDMLANVPIYYENRWQKPGDQTNIERFVANRSTTMASITSSRRLHPNDYARLKNLSFGLTAPKSWSKIVGVDQIRLYTSGANLWTWAKWKEYDPESYSPSGYVEWQQPPMRTWTFGIDVKF